MKYLIVFFLLTSLIACSNSKDSSDGSDAKNGGQGNQENNETNKKLKDYSDNSNCDGTCSVSEVQAIVENNKVNLTGVYTQFEMLRALRNLKTNNSELDKKVELLLLSQLLEQSNTLCEDASYDHRLGIQVGIFKQLPDQRNYRLASALVTHIKKLLVVANKDLLTLVKNSNEELIRLYPVQNDNKNAVKNFANSVESRLKTIYWDGKERVDFISELEDSLRELVTIETEVFGSTELNSKLGFTSSYFVKNNKFIKSFFRNFYSSIVTMRLGASFEKPMETKILVAEYKKDLVELESILRDYSATMTLVAYSGNDIKGGLSQRLRTLKRDLDNEQCSGVKCEQIADLTISKIKICGK